MSLGPAFRTPFTDLTGCLINAQQDKRCAPMEMNFIDCVEAYGVYRSIEKCGKLLADFEECVYGRKQFLRFEVIHKYKLICIYKLNDKSYNIFFPFVDNAIRKT